MAGQLSCLATRGIRLAAVCMAVPGKCQTALSPNVTRKTVAERLAVSAYPLGFEHHYWRPGALDEPLRMKKPAGIFVGSMADLFGHWVDSAQIREVLDVMQRADWHIFQTLSKYPIRLSEFNPYPPNVWVGVSIPAGHLMKPEGAARALRAYLRHMTEIEAGVRYMSIEPLWFDVSPVFEEWIAEQGALPFEWAIIGAASNGAKLYQPKPEVGDRAVGDFG